MGLLGIPTGPHEVQIKDGPVGSLSRGSGWESASTCIQVAGGTQFLLCSQESGPCLLAGCQLGQRLASGVIEFLIT